MVVEAFISYSHADEKALERIHKHLAMLKRDNTINAWTDHQILPGDKVGENISANLNKSSLFIAVVSPDYLASNYCYEKEFQQAQQLCSDGKIRIVPVILEPCDWLSSPLADYMALPKDGKAISEWDNPNNAYLDVVNGLRKLILAIQNPFKMVYGEKQDKPDVVRVPKIKRDFDAIQRAEFADQTFGSTAKYFQQSCVELTEVGEGLLKAKFERMDDTAFTCTIVNRNIRAGGEAHITVRRSKGRGHKGDLYYVFEPYADSGKPNGWISVETDNYNMYLTLNNFQDQGNRKFVAEQLAEVLWLNFVEHAGIKYD